MAKFKPVTGAKALKASFKALPKELRELVGSVNQTTAFAIAQSARARVPVRHGFLKQHIDTAFSKATGFAKVGVKKGRVAVAGRGGSALTSKGAKVVSPVRYAHLVERGTVKQKAQPFMGPAARAEGPAHVQRIKRLGPEVVDAIRAAGRKAGDD
jgi:HK97 gp10 family phage protein